MKITIFCLIFLLTQSFEARCETYCEESYGILKIVGDVLNPKVTMSSDLCVGNCSYSDCYKECDDCYHGNPLWFGQSHQLYPVSCADELRAKGEECGGLEWVTNWDDTACTGECIERCADETDAMEEQCGTFEFLAKGDIDLDTCEWSCDCTEEYDSLQEQCGDIGIAYIDSKTCQGECNSCQVYADACTETCGGIDKVLTFKCSDNGEEIIFTCSCDTPQQENPDNPLLEPDPDPLERDDPNEPDDPDQAPDEEPADDPDEIPEPDNYNDAVLKAIKENTDSLVNQGNTQNDLLHNLDKNLADGIGKLDNRLLGLGQSLDDNTDRIVDELGKIKEAVSGSKTITTSKGNDTTKMNVYDTGVEEVTENSLTDAISDFMASGLPMIGFINGSYIDISSAESRNCIQMWGGEICLDFEPMEPVLNWMGVLLVCISTLFAFQVVVKR